MDLKLAIPLVFLPSLSSNIMVMVEAGRFFEALKRFWPLYLSALPGLAIGIWFLDNTLVMILAFGKLGLVTSPVLFLSAGGILPVALGIFLGGKIRKKVTEETYRKIVLVLLIALGIIPTMRPFI